MNVFVDTSYFLARLSRADQWHRRAKSVWKREFRPVTSSLVINETVTLLQMRGHFSLSLDFLRQAKTGAFGLIVYPDAGVQAEGWSLFVRWGSSGASAVDCVSFAIMQQMGMKLALTFDGHFAAAGFRTLCG